MRRREFITLIGSAATWPLAARAQSRDRLRRVALLMGFSPGDVEGKASASAFQRRLEELGWQDGRNIQIDTRWAGGDPDKARILAKELIAMAPDVIVPNTNTVTAVLQHETKTIPIVFVFVGDPVGSGFVASFSKSRRKPDWVRPFRARDQAANGCRPSWRSHLTSNEVAFLLHPEITANVKMLQAAEAAAEPLGVELSPFGVHTALEIERSIAAFAPTPSMLV